jgi:hypothetical protein
MDRRAVRFGLVVLLVMGGVGAGVAARELHRQLDALSADERTIASTLDALTATVADIGAAQATYTAPDAALAPTAQRVTSLAQEIVTRSADLRPKLRSADAASKLQALASGADAFLAADQRVRAQLQEGDGALTAGGIFDDSRKALADMRTALSDIAAAEPAIFASERARLEQQLWTVLGATAGVWLLGLLLLARRPKLASSPAATTAGPGIAPHENTNQPESATGEPPAPAPAIDLAAAADLCTSIARLTSAAALPDLLARAASVLDASGIILWMGAGEELFAATAHGYDPKVIARLGPIHRSADNATADAWRTGEVRTVAGDMMSNGAIVAPMWGPDSCIGVLAAEIRNGREADAATRAVAAMIAAQLAAIVSAWPAADSGSRAAQG